jgi:hypothetical protein
MEHDLEHASQFETWGQAGQGKNVTVYANGTHTFVAVKLRGAWHFFGTSGLRKSGFS